jgi:hypothetical protein
MDTQFTRGKISDALFHLATASQPLPQRAWDAYMIATQGTARDGFESEYRALDHIFGGIRPEEVASRLTLDAARRGAEVLLEMYNCLMFKS